jgi:hypothetical protein
MTDSNPLRIREQDGGWAVLDSENTFREAAATREDAIQLAARLMGGQGRVYFLDKNFNVTWSEEVALASPAPKPTPTPTPTPVDAATRQQETRRAMAEFNKEERRKNVQAFVEFLHGIHPVVYAIGTTIGFAGLWKWLSS